MWEDASGPRIVLTGSAEEAAVLLGRIEPAVVTSDEEALEALTVVGTNRAVAAAAIRHSHRGSRP